MYKRPLARGLVAVAATATLVAGLASCSADSGETATSEGEPTLTLALSAVPPTFDPATIDGGQSSYIWGSLFDTLLYIAPDGTIEPNAAQSWEYSNDARTLTLTLREGMTFSNGDPVTASDVKATLDRTAATPGTQQGNTQYFESVEAPDDLTLVINLTQPDPSLLLNLATVTGLIGETDDLESTTLATDPIGSGPYILDEDKTQLGTTYVLERREDYWNADAFPYKTVTLKVIADTTATVNALQAGEIDGAVVQPAQVAQVEGAGFTTKQVSAGVALLDLADREGTLLPALADVRVRQAINMAFDRESWVENLLQGYGAPTGQIYNPSAGAWISDLNDTYAYDPEGAKELLAEAGYADGFSLTLPSTVLSTNYEPTISQSFADIGIDVTWETIPDTQLNSVLSSKKYPIAFWIDGYNQPVRETYNQLNVSGYLNPFGTTDPELTTLIDEAAVASDQESANEVYQEINRYVVENALTCPIFSLDAIWASKDVEFLPDGSPALYTLRIFAPVE